MSFLTPLYIAGLLAVSLPVLFHLIRRTPQGQTPFSSLMFLVASPPRITRRSRIEHWLLLLLRGLAVVLLALAFSRPFWRETTLGDDEGAVQRRIAIVVDTSASMRRGDLWPQAVRAVDQTLAECRPQDEVAVFACDESLRPIASFEDLAQAGPAGRAGVVRTRLKSLTPSWSATHLGQALVDATALLDQPHDASEERGRAARRIVLVSDMQTGSRLGVLGEFPWPADVQLELKPVAVSHPTNAGLERLVDETAEDAEAAGRAAALRIRVSNAADSAAEQFRLQWTNAQSIAEGKESGAASKEINAYVPPGESRVVRVPPPAASIGQPRLVLTGDAQDFDNSLFVVPAKRQQATVMYLGADAASDPEGLRYYLERALTSNPGRDVSVETVVPDGAIKFDRGSPPPLVVAAVAPSVAQASRLRDNMRRGGTTIYVVSQAGDGIGLTALTGLAIPAITEAKVDGYAMLGEIDFAHPLFASMAGPKFNDFTQIRFWKYRRVKLPPSSEFHIVAKFESGDPAIIEQLIGRGRLVVMAAGWQPSDGQLARSWKFPLMLSSLFDDPRGVRSFGGQYHVNQRVSLPERSMLPQNAAVTTPDGAKWLLTDDTHEFADTQTPGIYSLAMAAGPAEFAVNLDPAESATAPLAAEAFEQLGCRLVGRADAGREAARMQQLRDVELESRQRYWQWLAGAALGLLIVETWLAGRLSRPAAGGLAAA